MSLLEDSHELELAALAADVMYRWQEHVELRAATCALIESERPAAKPARRDPTAEIAGLDQLRQLPSAEYVERLTGRIPVARFVACPLHEDHSPSLHVSDSEPVWHCFGCGAGGDLVAFYAALAGVPVPTGREFVQFIDRLREAL